MIFTPVRNAKGKDEFSENSATDGCIFIIRGRLRLTLEDDSEHELSPSLNRDLKAVCKFCYVDIGEKERSQSWDQLQREIGFYTNELSKLQGECVPYFYGQFYGTVADNSQAVNCMLLEDAGKEVTYERFADSAGIEENFM